MGPPRMKIGEESETHVEFTFGPDRDESDDDGEEEEEEEDLQQVRPRQEFPEIHVCESPQCSREAHARCTVCWKAWYCSVACQRKGWAKHKKVCVPRPRPAEEHAPKKPPPRKEEDFVAYEPEEHIVIQEETDPLIPQHLVDDPDDEPAAAAE